MHVNGSQQDRIYELYYSEVGQHAILTPKEERVLLERYHCCPICSRNIPPRARTTNCPKCGKITPKKMEGRDYTCLDCSTNYLLLHNARICPSCGSGRDIEARQTLIRANLRFVIRRAKKFTLDAEVLGTLISAGNIGLMHAVDRFDISTRHRFLTYAEWWIRKEIMDELNNSNLIHIPTHKQKTLRRDKKEGQYVCVSCGVRTTSEYDVNHLPSCSDEKGHVFSIPLRKDSYALSDMLDIDDTNYPALEDVETNCCNNELATVLRTVMSKLCVDERDKFIVVGYYDAVTADRKSDPKKLPQLAAITGITPERVRQIKERLLLSLRKELQGASLTTSTSLLPEELH